VRPTALPRNVLDETGPVYGRLRVCEYVS
jgi:hypothetical protein